MTETAAHPLFSQALVEESAKKSALVWVCGPQGPSRPLWHVWHQGAVCLVAGPGEQPVDGMGLVDGGTATVTARSKDKGVRLVVWSARVRELTAASEEWATTVAELRSKRLNASDSEQLTERWATECRILRLVPEGEPSQEPGSMPHTAVVAPPLATSATTREPQPAGLPKLLFRKKRKTS